MNDYWISELLSLQQKIRSKAFANDPIERLVQEHRIISDLACTLEIWALRMEAGYQPSTECMKALMDFLTHFVDEVHHRKEERILIPKLVEFGLLVDGDPALQEDHEDERYLVGELQSLVRHGADHGAWTGSHFASLARELAEFQRRHLEDESRGIYALLDHLHAEQRRALRRELGAFDLDTEPVLARWRATLRRLLDSRGVHAGRSVAAL